MVNGCDLNQNRDSIGGVKATDGISGEESNKIKGAKKEASLYIKELARDHGILFVGLVETKIGNFSKVDLERILGKDWDLFMVPSDGLSRGLLLLWRSDLASFIVIKDSDQCVIGNLNVPNKEMWMLATVYESKEVFKKRSLWGCIQEVANLKLPLAVGGDFICIISQDENRGGRKFLISQGPIEMVDFMNENDFHDVKVVGPRDTWCNNKSGSSRMLERLDRDLHFWGKAKAKKFTSEKDKLKKEIFHFQEEEANVGWLCEEKLLMLRTNVRNLNVALSKLNTWWKQRAKVRWYEEGDANTKFFHSFANARRCKIYISQVKNGSGKLTEDPKEIQEVFYRYFFDKWKQRNCLEDNWPAQYNSLDDDDRRRLNAEVSDLEIIETIKSLGNIRAPGVDGISYSFFKAYWNTVGNDVCNEVKYFFATGRMCKDWKDTLVAKMKNPVTPAGFRPISLCNSIYKIVVKSLLNRMSKVADGMVAIKLDMEQAYDSMSWKMLHRMMVILEFPKQFMDLVMECITETRYAITVNGGLSNWIKGKSGFRQAMICNKSVNRGRRKKISRLLEIMQVEEMDYLGTKFALRRLKRLILKVF
ncbi:uncharacterized protein LOC110111753 [Dendrobium catenatum]|uniref:uncharacterized protein LOC110111753 n=1 Tax=Dendrobium catenatum TaxID=906689 RepID=UPI0009F2B054|nr:uncharacterized protein LOC110111753 [Dendrobium catenatum]